MKKTSFFISTALLALAIAIPMAPLLMTQSDFPDSTGSWPCDIDAIFESYEYVLIPAAGQAVYQDHNNNNEIFRKELTEFLAKHEMSPPLV